MSAQPDASTAGLLTRLPIVALWSLLVALSVTLSVLLEIAGIPAARLLGPMIAGIVLGVNGGAIRVPRTPYLGAQGIVGCLIASVISPQIIQAFLKQWPLFFGIVLVVIAASSVLGWLMSRWRVLPGTTAVWGSSPGAATAMMLMAEAYGADAQLVALMQYLRVVFVAIAASAIARLWINVSGAAAPTIAWFPPIDWLPFLETFAIAVVGVFLGQALRIPAGALLLPMAAGAALHISGLVQIELPPWLLAISYALIGWNIGLGFTRRILRHASRALPQIVLSILALIAFCCGLALLLVKTLGIDPLTAYLATSPGGMDSIAIIAASSKVDISFVMALQTARFVVILLIGPRLARLIADRTAAKIAGGRESGK
ncbi:AbrB family transcriptional regulator [Methylocapsa sp. S129]|uniref:AbrB family transcriptional regulator n=1 Tax=Methylocapsa sp. S129 TaxID=1641869 RepID=UPI00131B8924|nr:AbrB family transcriptional regulator [Methylocapsa sp. S129]